PTAESVALSLHDALPIFRAQAILDRVPGFYGHVSNFSLSWMLLAGAGFLWLTMGMHMRHMGLAALALVVANVACEFLLPWLNTRDRKSTRLNSSHVKISY